MEETDKVPWRDDVVHDGVPLDVVLALVGVVVFVGRASEV